MVGIPCLATFSSPCSPSSSSGWRQRSKSSLDRLGSFVLPPPNVTLLGRWILLFAPCPCLSGRRADSKSSVVGPQDVATAMEFSPVDRSLEQYGLMLQDNVANFAVVLLLNLHLLNRNVTEQFEMSSKLKQHIEGYYTSRNFKLRYNFGNLRF